MKKTILAMAALVAASAAGAADYHCDKCEEWNKAQKAFNVYGNTWYVGTQKLSSILITSPQGHILIDGALPQSAPLIADNIRALGFKVEDIKLILNSHAHFDHAGGIAELAGLSGARVAASPFSAQRLKDGNPHDAQFGEETPFPTLEKVHEIKDGEVLRVGKLALTAHATPGHTAGATSWTWRSCEGSTCRNMVYADSLTAPGFQLIGNPRQPDAVQQFRHTFDVVAALPCDILMTPHPDAWDLLEREAKREAGEADALVDAQACRLYAQTMRGHFEQQLAQEMAKGQPKP